MQDETLIQLEEVEIEEYASRDEKPPRARRYVIRVDKQRVVVNGSSATGAEILALVNKSSQTHKLYQHRHGHQPVEIQPDQRVDFTHPGVERFTTMPKDTTEGLESGAQTVRRQFLLPQPDEDYLNRLLLPWESINDNGTQWLVIRGWVLPHGYNYSNVSVALLIPPNYSDTPLDMVYFSPSLARSDGKAIAALSTQTIGGDVWQRWSRHRTAANPWRPGEDDISTHLTLVDEWLRREFERS